MHLEVHLPGGFALVVAAPAKSHVP